MSSKGLKKTTEILRSFLGTPWIDQGQTRRGVNCTGLFVAMAKERGNLEHFHTIIKDEVTRARPGYHGELLKEMQKLFPFRPASKVEVGDLLLFRFSDEPIHVAYVSEPGIIIHASRQIGRVVEQRIPRNWKPLLAFHVKELHDD